MTNYKVTNYYKSISKVNGPLWKQYMPQKEEELVLPYEVSDPLDENKHMVSPRLIHRYKDRVLLLTTDLCLLYCRHCFRRDYINNGNSIISNNDLELACDYIKKHKEIHEVLLSGGDPLTIDIQKLSTIISRLKDVRQNLIIRIGTRVPIVEPDYITHDFVSMLKQHKNIWIVLQVNHPNELTEKVYIALNKLSNAGIPLVNQSVLLKGINDSVEVLKDLSFKLLEFRVKPYYIFQGDLARGTSHFRVPLKKGLELMAKLRNEVSGLAMPQYAVDIPGGGGKIPLNSDFIIKEDKKFFYLKNNEGFVGRYPKE